MRYLIIVAVCALFLASCGEDDGTCKKCTQITISLTNRVGYPDVFDFDACGDELEIDGQRDTTYSTGIVDTLVTTTTCK